VHPLLEWPYRALIAGAELAARLPLVGEGKVVRSLRARRDALRPVREWAAAHRDLARPLIWFHAPSVGEGLQAKPVIQLLRVQRPDIQIAYSHFSPSAERFAAGVGADVAFYLPFDSRTNAAHLLETLRPSALIYSKLDVWPVLTASMHAGGVKIAMISATLAAGSSRTGGVAHALLGEAYAALDAVGAIDADDAERLRALGVAPTRIRVTGDTRYDQVAARASACDRASTLLAPLVSARPTLVAGSTWPADEAVLLAAWRTLMRDVPNARLIIAPHEPTAEHCAPIEHWAASARLKCARLADATNADDVILVDRVGVLGDLYALGNAAFVGGGFHAAGLHSVLEPAAFGLPVLFGPRHTMSRDAGLLLEKRGGEAVQDESELARAMRILFTEPETCERAGRAAKSVVSAGVGAAERSVDLVLRLLTED
jgi:3-deoxy-D-manno-octulosonic-acid transferase